MAQNQNRIVELPLNDHHLGVEMATAAQVSQLGDLIAAGAQGGVPYTLGEMRADELTLSALQMTPAERQYSAGTVVTLYEAPDYGQRVQAIHYTPNGRRVLARPYTQPDVIGALITERKTSGSLFRAKFNVLDSGEIEIDVTCQMLDPMEKVRAQAMREWAKRWGLEGAWDVYLTVTPPKAAANYRGPITQPVATKTLRSLKQIMPA